MLVFWVVFYSEAVTTRAVYPVRLSRKDSLVSSHGSLLPALNSFSQTDSLKPLFAIPIFAKAQHTVRFFDTVRCALNLLSCYSVANLVTLARRRIFSTS